MARGALLLIVCLLSTVTVGADEVARSLLIDDFEDIQNRLGGYRNPFQRSPSQAQASRVTSDYHGAAGQAAQATAGRSARIRGQRAETGFCGYWLHFFDFKSSRREYLNTDEFNFLSFWVKGEQGGESFLIKLSDRHWVEKEDALTIGSVSEFLPGGVTKQWREVLVPLDRLTGLDRHQMAGMTLEFQLPGDHLIYLDGVCFKVTANSIVAPTPAEAVIREPRSQVPRKLWVWNTDALLRDKQAAETLFDCCTEQGIDEVWVQLVYAFDELATGNSDSAPTVSIQLRPELGDFLRRAHARGIRVHALDGAAHYSQRTHHWIPLAVVDGVIAFNRLNAPEERFDGVHFDNEPYLLVGWIDPVLREEILLEFLELNAECQRRIRANSSMQFGIDIPFWWQEMDVASGRAIGEVEFRGKRQAASFHCLEMLDNVGVMNYRDTADGADGMIAHGRTLLAFADRVDRATVFMGVETFQSPPTTVCFAVGLPRAAFFSALRDSAKTLARNYTLHGFRLRTIDDGTHIHVGIEIPRGTPRTRKRDAQRALSQLARQTGVFLDANENTAAGMASARKFALSNSEWSDFQTMPILDASSDQTFPGFRLTHTMRSKITFADDTAEQFVAESQAAESYFNRYTSFGGIAVHYYETFRQLLNP